MSILYGEIGSMPLQNFKIRKMPPQSFDFVKCHSKSQLLRKLPPLPNYYTFVIRNKQNILYFEQYFRIFQKYPYSVTLSFLHPLGSDPIRHSSLLFRRNKKKSPLPFVISSLPTFRRNMIHE